MKKKSQLLDLLLVIFGFIVVAAGLILTFTGKVNTATGIVIMVIGAAVAVAALYFKNAKNSAYGGRFSHNYPDAHS